MYGYTVGYLNVYLKQDNVETLIWTRYQTQGNQWLKGTKTIKSDTTWEVGVLGVIFIEGLVYVG